MSERCIGLSVLTCCLLAAPAYAGSTWVEFVNETGTVLEGNCVSNGSGGSRADDLRSDRESRWRAATDGDPRRSHRAGQDPRPSLS